MADTKHLDANPPVESDGVNYRGIVWFVVILTATTVTCQILVWAGFALMERIHVTNSGIARAPLSAPGVNVNVGLVSSPLRWARAHSFASFLFAIFAAPLNTAI